MYYNISQLYPNIGSMEYLNSVCIKSISLHMYVLSSSTVYEFKLRKLNTSNVLGYCKVFPSDTV